MSGKRLAARAVWERAGRMGRAVVLVGAALWMVGCGDGEATGGGGPGSDPPVEEPMTEWERRRYIEKVAQALRRGRGIGPGDDLAALLAMNREQLVDHFMADPIFRDTVLEFNLFFLGLQPGSPRRATVTSRGTFRDENNQLDRATLVSRRAIHSALELGKGGDYLSLLAPQLPVYTFLEPPVRASPPPPAGAPPPTTGEWALSDAALRKQRLDRALASADTIIQLIEAGAPELAICKEVNQGDFLLLLFGPGLDGSQVDLNLALSLLFDPRWLAGLVMPCQAPQYTPAPNRVALVRNLKEKFQTLAAIFEEHAAKGAVGRASLDTLIALDAQALDLGNQTSSFDFGGFYDFAENSSTNYNRRRAAYVLDRFFCDDLKPINAALPAAHAGDRHGSDPACMSCHYKLDPMAGFFKDRGGVGIDFGGLDQLVFDDLGTISRASYAAAWAAPAGSGRAWDIGYIRSSTDPSVNTYGETLDDLGRIIQTAPEVKACLVRRTFEFFNGKDQLVDPGYLAALTSQFLREAEQSSSAAFKGLVRRVLTGKTFRQPDPRSDDCYDLAPGPRSSRPPCSVAFIFQESCATCHSGAAPQAGLDLTGWTRDQAGVETFPHRGADRRQLPAGETLRRMLDRITTTDPARLMPLGRSMPVSQREALYLWIDGRMQAGATR